MIVSYYFYGKLVQLLYITSWAVTEKVVKVKMVWLDHSWLAKSGPARLILATKSGPP